MLVEPDDQPLRAAFEQVIFEEVVPAYFREGSPLREAWRLATMETMLRGTVLTFEEQAKRRALAQGIERGIEQGVEEFRGTYARMTRLRFGRNASERLEALLGPVLSLSLLGKLGDIVVAARTAEELLSTVAARIAAESAPGRSRA